MADGLDGGVDGRDLLDLPMPPGNGHHAGTVREYLAATLAAYLHRLWCLGGATNMIDLYEALVELQPGGFGGLDVARADRLILAACRALGEDPHTRKEDSDALE